MGGVVKYMYYNTITNSNGRDHHRNNTSKGDKRYLPFLDAGITYVGFH